MSEIEALLVFPVRLNEAGIDYMVTGSIASMTYGQPRFTQDVDLIITLAGEQAEKLIAAFPEIDFYCPPLEVIRREISRNTGGHFNIIDQNSGAKADIYPLGKDPLHQWAFPRRRQMPVGDTMIWMAPPEYVIIRKLQYYHQGGSERHLTDIRGMLDVSTDTIDRQTLRDKIAEYHLDEEWQKIG